MALFAVGALALGAYSASEQRAAADNDRRFCGVRSFFSS